MKQTFFNKNKVLIFGLLSAVALTLNETFRAGVASPKILVFAALIAAASFLAKNLRGQWATITGLVGNALVVYLTQYEQGNVSIEQLILQFIIGFLAIIMPPAKSIGYERTQVITDAKAQGESVQPSVAKP